MMICYYSDVANVQAAAPNQPIFSVNPDIEVLTSFLARKRCKETLNYATPLGICYQQRAEKDLRTVNWSLETGAIRTEEYL